MHASIPTRRRLPLWAMVVACAACAVAACSLGEKAAMEERITAAPGHLEGALVRGTLTVESLLVDLPAGGVSGFGGMGMPGAPDQQELPEGGVAMSNRTVSFELDLAGRRAALRRPDAERSFVLIDDLAYYGRRAGVPDDDARPWVRLALDDLAEGVGAVDPLAQDRAAADAIAALHPAVVADLVAGTLTGSIEDAGREPIAGTSTTRYEVNIDFEKAFRDKRRSRYPEHRLEGVESLIDALGISGTVHPATVWLDDRGQLRRVVIRLKQRPLKNVEFAFVITMDVTDADGGGTGPVELPSPREVLTVDSVLRFVATVAESESESDAEPEVDQLAADLATATDGEGEGG